MTDLPNPFSEPSSTGGHQEAPASTSTVTVAAGDAGAAIQELLEAIGGDCRFVLDEEAFMAAIEPPPLFLQRTA